MRDKDLQPVTETLDVRKDFVPKTHMDSPALKHWGRRVGSPTIPEQGILQAHKALGIGGLQRWSKMGVTGRVGVSSMAVLAPTLSFWPTCSLAPLVGRGRAGCGFFQALINCLMQAEKKEEAHL